MTESPKKVNSYTGTLSVLAQIMTGLGFITMILGGVVLVLALIAEIAAGADEKQGLAFVLGSGAMLLYGLLVAGLGQLLMAIRSIAINCAVIAEKST
ncbi:MAG: hypothetical protein VX641_04400 [Planctomycetota bacterium]|nr:hypothetical protein [Planctomycetota bacterium]